LFLLFLFEYTCFMIAYAARVYLDKWKACEVIPCKEWS
jgi:hypothetical protein